MKSKMIMCVAGGAMALASCSVQKQAAISSLSGEWNITEASGKAVTTKDGTLPFIGFNLKDGNVYGNSGCNRIMAGIDKDKGTLMFGNMVSTMMACPDMDTEQQVLGALTKAKTFKTQGDSVVVLYGEGKDMVAKLSRRFTVATDSYIDGQWNIVKIYGIAPKQSEQVPTMAFDTKNMRISGTTGCNRIMGKIERDAAVEHSMILKGVGTTRMACPDMDNERNILQALTAVNTAGKLPGGNIALFDRSGNIVMELAK